MEDLVAGSTRYPPPPNKKKIDIYIYINIKKKTHHMFTIFALVYYPTNQYQEPKKQAAAP